MDAKLTKSLTDLIDETLQELDELRKSRFAASEIKIEGPGDGIAGKPSDGKLDASKAEDKKDDDKDDDKDDKKEDKAEKGENESAAKGENEEAAKADKDEDKDDKKSDKKEDKDDKKEDKKDKDAKGGDEHEAKERKAISDLAGLANMKKSLEDSESLMKSYVEERIKPVEDKLATILDLVNKTLINQLLQKGVTARTTPLLKSADEGGEPLSKSEVASKLFELKKSGTKVDSLDITKAEMGQDLKTIVKKYEIS